MINKQNNLVWIDLEMTGLFVEKDVIIEIASIVTTSDLEIIEEGPSLAIHQPEEVLQTMNDWCKTYHGKSGLTKAVQDSTISLRQAEEQTVEFLKKFCIPGKTILCGNTIWQDRLFLQKYMPKILYFMHYRMIDVTSIKELIQRWYPTSPYISFSKTDTHRALSDIKESIEELRHYKRYFFVAP